MDADRQTGDHRSAHGVGDLRERKPAGAGLGRSVRLEVATASQHWLPGAAARAEMSTPCHPIRPKRRRPETLVSGLQSPALLGWTTWVSSRAFDPLNVAKNHPADASRSPLPLVGIGLLRVCEPRGNSLSFKSHRPSGGEGGIESKSSEANGISDAASLISPYPTTSARLQPTRDVQRPSVAGPRMSTLSVMMPSMPAAMSRWATPASFTV